MGFFVDITAVILFAVCCLRDSTSDLLQDPLFKFILLSYLIAGFSYYYFKLLEYFQHC